MDTLKVKTLAIKVEEALAKYRLNEEPKQIDPTLALVAPTNRNGATPNVQHVHYGIMSSFISQGFDKQNRPRTGICVKYTS